MSEQLYNGYVLPTVYEESQDFQNGDYLQPKSNFPKTKDNCCLEIKENHYTYPRSKIPFYIDVTDLKERHELEDDSFEHRNDSLKNRPLPDIPSRQLQLPTLRKKHLVPTSVSGWILCGVFCFTVLSIAAAFGFCFLYSHLVQAHESGPDSSYNLRSITTPSQNDDSLVTPTSTVMSRFESSTNNKYIMSYVSTLSSTTPSTKHNRKACTIFHFSTVTLPYSSTASPSTIGETGNWVVFKIKPRKITKEDGHFVIVV